MPTRTILVVEDDPNDETLTLRALRQVPCSVVVAHTGKEALDFLLRRGPFEGRTSPDPKVMFVDNTLPGFGGIDLIRAIRDVQALATLPIVILSGNSDETLIDKCCRAGANSFLEKPIEMSDYMQQVGAAAQYWLTLNRSPSMIAGRATAL